MYITNLPVTLEMEDLLSNKEFDKFIVALLSHIDPDLLADELERRGWQVAAPEEEFPEEEEPDPLEQEADEEADRLQRDLDAYREERAWA
jgi:hypothetical protein|nr:MAG TPA: hypothetical protein [Caudoviricetes sp.]